MKVISKLTLTFLSFMFQFLIGSMKEWGYQHKLLYMVEFQFLIGSMKDNTYFH